MFSRLMANTNLPRYFNKDPMPGGGVAIEYVGTAAVATIYHRRLILSVTGGIGTDQVVDLKPLTLGQLVTAINLLPGYSAILLGGVNVSALTLIETNEANIANTLQNFQTFTSILWMLVSMLAWALLDCRDNQNEAFAEAFIRTADPMWLDVWGREYGRTDRTFDDTDFTYAKHIPGEVIRPRLNANAIENAVKDLTDVIISISDRQSDVVWHIGQALGQNMFMDYDHAKGNFIVTVVDELYRSNTPWSPATNPPTLPSPITTQQALDWASTPPIKVNGDSLGRLDLGSAVRVIVDRNRARGVRPIYNYSPGPPRKVLFLGPGMLVLFPFSPPVTQGV